MIYQPHMEQSDWSEFTTMVQIILLCILVLIIRGWGGGGGGSFPPKKGEREGDGREVGGAYTWVL